MISTHLIFFFFNDAGTPPATATATAATFGGRPFPVAFDDITRPWEKEKRSKDERRAAIRKLIRVATGKEQAAEPLPAEVVEGVQEIVAETPKSHGRLQINWPRFEDELYALLLQAEMVRIEDARRREQAMQAMRAAMDLDDEEAMAVL